MPNKLSSTCSRTAIGQRLSQYCATHHNQRPTSPVPLQCLWHQRGSCARKCPQLHLGHKSFVTDCTPMSAWASSKSDIHTAVHTASSMGRLCMPGKIIIQQQSRQWQRVCSGSLGSCSKADSPKTATQTRYKSTTPGTDKRHLEHAAISPVWL